MIKRTFALFTFIVFLAGVAQAATLKDIGLPGKLPEDWTIEETQEPDVYQIVIPDGADLKAELIVGPTIKRRLFGPDDLNAQIKKAADPLVKNRQMQKGDFFTQESSDYNKNVYAKQIRFQLSNNVDSNDKIWGQISSFYYNDQVYVFSLTSPKTQSDDYVHQLLNSVFGPEKKRRFNMDTDSYQF